MASSNTRITDLEPVEFDSNSKEYSFIRDEKLVEIAQNGTNKRATVKELKDSILSQIYPIGSIYHSADEKGKNPSELMGFGTWVPYGYAYNKSSGTMTGAPAALFGYKENDSKFTVSPVIRGADSASISGGYINPTKHWGWKRLRISNFRPHTHPGKGSTEWAWKHDNTDDPVHLVPIDQYDPGDSGSIEEETWDTVDSIDISVRHGYGILTSSKAVLDDIIGASKDLGTCQTDLLKDPRVKVVKVTKNGKTKTVNVTELKDSNGRQVDCPFVTFNGTQWTYLSVDQPKYTTNKQKQTIIQYDQTTKVDKWLPKQTLGTKRGNIVTPSTSKDDEDTVKYSKYNPIANPVTLNGKVRIKANNSSGYTDISGFSLGDYVEYTDSDGATIKMVYSKDYEATDKNKTVDVNQVNKWIPFHDVWDPRYWGRTDTNITSGDATSPVFMLSQRKNNQDPTEGYYGTVLNPKVKSTAHNGDIIAYNNKEYLYNAMTSEELQKISSTNSADQFKVKKITRSKWIQDDSGVNAMTKDVPENLYVGGETVRDMVAALNSPVAGLSQITVERQNSEYKWTTGGALRLVGQNTLATVPADYGLVLWPDEITGGFSTDQINYYKTMFRYFNNIADCRPNYNDIVLFRAEIAEDSINLPGTTTNTKTEYWPEFPQNENGTISQDTLDSWMANTVDNWSTSMSKIEESHVPGTIVNTLPPYVTVHRWVRIA